MNENATPQNDDTDYVDVSLRITIRVRWSEFFVDKDNDWYRQASIDTTVDNVYDCLPNVLDHSIIGVKVHRSTK